MKNQLNSRLISLFLLFAGIGCTGKTDFSMSSVLPDTQQLGVTLNQLRDIQNAYTPYQFYTASLNNLKSSTKAKIPTTPFNASELGAFSRKACESIRENNGVLTPNLFAQIVAGTEVNTSPYGITASGLSTAVYFACDQYVPSLNGLAIALAAQS